MTAPQDDANDAGKLNRAAALVRQNRSHAMKRTPLVIAIVLLAASTSPLFAQKGGFGGGPIGPGSRDGLQPSVNDARPNAFGYEPERPVIKKRVKNPKRR